jgi:type I restriction enzyme S subunit
MDALVSEELPPGWALVSLGDISEFVMGQAPASSDTNFDGIGMPFVKTGEFGAKRPIIREWTTRPLKLATFSDVLICVVGATVGKLNLGADCAIGRSVAAIRPRAGISQEYIYHFLQTRIQAFRSASMGTAQGVISSNMLRDERIPLAPAGEQERIVAAVNALFEEVEAGEAALARAREGLTQFRASLLHAACTGALTADWRDTQTQHCGDLIAAVQEDRRATWMAAERARLADRGRTTNEKAIAARYEQPLEPDLADLPALPAGWLWTSLDALIVSGPQNGLYLPQTEYGDGTPIVRIDDFQEGWARKRQDLRRVTCGSDLQATYSLNRDDLVINRVNSMTHLGKTLLVPDDLGGALFESNMMRMRLSRHVNAAFVLAYLQSPAGRGRLIADAKWAVNQASINQTDVRRTTIPLPPRAEQDEIVSRVMDGLRAAVELRAEIDADANATAALRQSILHAAFTGRLVPQNPADEPAAALLARLRTAPAAARRPRARRTTAQPELIETPA